MTGGDIRIRVLIDNAKGAPGLQSQWGLSFWIEAPEARVMLDCGGSGAFLENARRLREPVETADAFVLSHGHQGRPDRPAGPRPRRAARGGGALDLGSGAA